MRAKGLPSCITITLVLMPEASLSMMNVLEKLGMAMIGEEHMETFNICKYSSIASDQLKAFFLSKVVSGAVSFKKFGRIPCLYIFNI